MANIDHVDVYFKTPDAVDMAADDMMLQEDDRVMVKRQCAKWIEYGEHVRIRIHLDTGTAEVLPAR